MANTGTIQRKTADVIKKRQYELCPLSQVSEPGHVHIRDTIRIEDTGPDQYEVREGDADHTYGPHLEYGTDRMAARPHQRPALQEGLRFQREEYRRLGSR